MRIGISVKWTASAVFLVILVVFVYAFFTNADTQESVDRETERIRRIQYEALDQLGAQTTKTVTLPASSLMFDNDLEGLRGLIAPIISGNSDEGYSAVYATIVAPEGRVWITSVTDKINKIEMANTTYFDRAKKGSESVENIEESVLEPYKATTEPKYEDFTRKVVTSDNESLEMKVRQYTMPIKGRPDEDGTLAETQGYLIIGYSIEGLEKEIQAIRDQGEQRKDEMFNRAIKLALMAVIFGILLAWLQAFMTTRNIKKLSKAASLIASGNLSVRSQVHSSDEIGQLGEQFNIMADRVQILLQETEQKAMLEKEVDIARSIQATLLPPAGYAECGCVSLNGFFQPASSCGGDFWSYNLLPDRSVLITIGDVTGHGVPSAMITACAKAALDTLLHMQTTQSLNLAKLLEEMNVAICNSAKRTLFMTFQAVLISPDGRFAEIGNAGHNFPLIMHGNEVRATVVRGERLGDNLNAKYTTTRIDLAHGDMFLLYTDGLTEYMNLQNVEYGEKRLRKVLAPLGTADVNTALKGLWDDFAGFCAGAPQNDDVTLTFVKIS